MTLAEPAVHAQDHWHRHLPGGPDELAWSTSIHAAGTLANRPAAGPTNKGALYFATDNGLLYRSDGSTWSQVATSATPSGTAGGDLTGTYPNPTLAVDRIPKSIGTTKGDLIAFTGSATPVRVAAGTDYARLWARAGATNGVEYERRIGCHLRRVANQSIGAFTNASISWDTEDEDTDGFIAVTSTTVTIPTGFGGLYNLTIVTKPQSGTSTGSNLGITVSGAQEERVWQDVLPNRAIFSFAGRELAAGTTIVTRQYNNDAGAINYQAELWLYRVSI